MSRISIYYDGDCPLCRRYSSYLNLARDNELQLVDLRQAAQTAQSFQQRGLQPDQGMIVEIDGRYYTGADAMHVLSLLDQPDNIFMRLQSWLFARSWLAGLLYPLLRLGRNALLLMLGRRRLDDTAMENGLRLLFATALGVFAWLHFLVYAFQFNVDQLISPAVIGVLGLLLLLRPASSRLLVLLLLVMLVDSWLQMPSLSNHTIIKNFLMLGVLLAGGWHGLRGNSMHAFLNSLYPLGRWLLLLMYVFGVFHKLNSDFLHPEVSCATALWQQMPSWLAWLDALAIGNLTIWGTLVIESAIIAMLLLPGLRFFGITVGIGFHSLLALSGYAMYATFSMLSFLLHLLFLSPQAANQIVASAGWQSWRALTQQLSGIALVMSIALLLLLLAYNGSYSEVGLIWIVLMTPLFVLIVRHGCVSDQLSTRQLLTPKPVWLSLVVVLFFFNGITPYLGLKTSQSINMFANLRLEGGASNHYLVRQVGPFGYVDDVAVIEAASGSLRLIYVAEQNLAMVYYDLLNELERHPAAKVSYVRQGERYQNQSAATLADDIDSMLHPRWVRKWFHFNVVDLNQPKQCALDR